MCSVWYRTGNQLVKQARPASKQLLPYTLTREFTHNHMLTTISTDNNTLRVNM